ncbi:hypothetical protein [Actinoplanes xinjiangensis]|uniref:Uncharacterized protein n=1 Tax=Actinoplanes xinjiangensis TaxID=512350 RepID=A0A316EAL6_9ACTN|nr:hypothetical protein [Actinoplanes xinjiangensis]PWK26976.1 hypothetical protein BC793_15715 [Actinoplanes xinjiangensis]GIF45336.1 hypothetical protein Axi01nite_96470 [Actinoplanes xinjiangensis]
MEALVVIAFVLLAMRIVGFVALVLADREPQPTPTPPADPCLSPVWALPPAAATDPELALLHQLRSGEIGREQYRKAIAYLAHRDAAAQPLRTPAR